VIIVNTAIGRITGNMLKLGTYVIILSRYKLRLIHGLE
jgi:hypothetical protein